MTDLLESPIPIKDLEYKFATSGIYAIYCKHTDTYYIGQSVVVLRRIVEHFTQLREGTHQNTTLQSEYNAFGEDEFVVDLLIDMPNAGAIELKRNEYLQIQRFKAHGKSLYNKTGLSINVSHPTMRQQGKDTRTSETNRTMRTNEIMSHSERVNNAESNPAICYDCGIEGYSLIDVFECDDGHSRCQRCIEAYLDTWKISGGDIPSSPLKMYRGKHKLYRRWLIPTNASFNEQAILAIRRFSDLFGKTPNEIFVHPETIIPGREYRGIHIATNGFTPKGYIDIAIE